MRSGKERARALSQARIFEKHFIEGAMGRKLLVISLGILVPIIILLLIGNKMAEKRLDHYAKFGRYLVVGDFQPAQDPSVGFTWKPNQRAIVPEFGVEVDTNAQGFRSRSFEAAASSSPQPPPPRVVLLGDSIAFGVYLPEQKTLSARIEEETSLLGSAVQVYDLGIPAYHMRKKVASYMVYGKSLKPDAVILQAKPDDFRALEPLLLKGWISRVPLASWIKVRLYRSEEAQKSRDEGIASYKQLAESCKASSIPLCVVYFPFLDASPMSNVWKRDKAEMEAAGVTVLDVIPVLSPAGGDLAKFRILPEDPFHPNAQAVAMAAKSCAYWLVGALQKGKAQPEAAVAQAPSQPVL